MRTAGCYFTSERPTEAGSDICSRYHWNDGNERQVTSEPGTHSVSGHRHGKAFVATYGTWESPWKTRILDQEGTLRSVLDRGEAPWLELRRPTPEWVTVEAKDGTALNGLLIPPLNREDGKKYPVVTYVYGGPSAQLVRNAFGVMSSFHVYLSQQGFGVFVLDNRGSANRSRQFTRSIYKRFADIEVEDQLAGGGVPSHGSMGRPGTDRSLGLELRRHSVDHAHHRAKHAVRGSDEWSAGDRLAPI